MKCRKIFGRKEKWRNDEWSEGEKEEKCEKERYIRKEEEGLKRLKEM